MTEEKERDKTVKLSWRDYVAIVIASCETTLLPFIIVLLVLVFLAIAFRR